MSRRPLSMLSFWGSSCFLPFWPMFGAVLSCFEFFFLRKLSFHINKITMVASYKLSFLVKLTLRISRIQKTNLTNPLFSFCLDFPFWFSNSGMRLRGHWKAFLDTQMMTLSQMTLLVTQGRSCSSCLALTCSHWEYCSVFDFSTVVKDIATWSSLRPAYLARFICLNS